MTSGFGSDTDTNCVVIYVYHLYLDGVYVQMIGYVICI